MNKNKLSIGLLLDSYSIPSWIYEIIESINHSDHSEISLVILKNGKLSGEISGNNSKKQKWNELLFYMYSKWDKKHFKPTPDAFELKNLKNILNCSEINVIPKFIESKDYIMEQDVATIQTHSIDVLIKFGFNDLGGEIFESSKHGIWAYHEGDFNLKRGNATAVLEVLEKWDETRMTLLQLSESKNDSVIIYQTFFSTDHVSVSRNRNMLFNRSTSMLPRKLEELYKSGEAQFFHNIKKSKTEPVINNNREFNIPSNEQMLKGIYRNWKRAITGMVSRKFYMQQWILLFSFEKTDKLSTSFQDFKRILPPKDCFWADPFAIERNGRFYIFIEELVYAENKGKISVIEMDHQGNYGVPTVVLETPYHLSYPFLIEDDGVLYMLPETEGNRTIELYKCVDFPTKWELQETLMDDLMAVDTTIYKRDNKFWLFTNVKEYMGTTVVNELMLFSSDSLLAGNWISHPKNPIAIDHRLARPAGTIFENEGRVFRPAQNCSKHYGYGMQIMEIITLTEHDYEERLIQSIYPDWEKDVKCVHTLNFSGKLTFIDAVISRKK